MTQIGKKRDKVSDFCLFSNKMRILHQTPAVVNTTSSTFRNLFTTQLVFIILFYFFKLLSLYLLLFYDVSYMFVCLF